MMFSLTPTVPQTRSPSVLSIETRTFAATIKPRIESDRGFRVAGKVARRLVQNGDNVQVSTVDPRGVAANGPAQLKLLGALKTALGG